MKAVKHDSDSSNSESQSESDSDSGSKSDRDKNYGKSHRRYDSDDDRSSDMSLKHPKLNNTSKGRRHDDCSSDEDRGYKTKNSKNKHRDSYDDDSSDDGYHHSQKRTQPRNKRQHDSDGSSDEGPKNKNQRLKGPSRSRRHDSDDEFCADRSKKNDDREKHTSKADEFDTFKKLEQLYKSKEDGAGYEREDILRGEMKVDLGRWDGQPDEKSKKLYPAKEKGSGEAEIELGRQNKSYREENHTKDSRPPRHSEKKLDADDHGDSIGSRNEARHGNKRDGHYHEDHGRSRREWEDEEDCHGRKHDRNGGKDSNRKREEKLEHPQVKRGRDQEVEHTSKRARYDDVRGTGRRDDYDRNDDRRSRHR